MPVDVSWYDEKACIVWIQFSGRWTIAEFRSAIPDIYALIESKTSRVDTIVDLTNATAIPRDVITSLRGSTLRAPDNWQSGVIIGAGRFVDALLTAFRAVYPKVVERYQVAKTHEDAIEMINKLREDNS